MSSDHIFIAAQLGQTHRPPGVEPLGGDTHLTAQAELTAVSEPGRGVPIDGGAVHLGQEAGGGLVIFRDDGLGVPGGVGGDMGHGLLQAVHHPHRQDIIQKLRVEIPGPNIP